jgi:uncharacterized membrane protein
MNLVAKVSLWLLALGVAGYSIVVYSLLPMGALVEPGMRVSFESHRSLVYTHIFAASVAMATGPLQFWSRFRRRRPLVHRWVGRIYLAVGVAVGGVAGFFMALHAYGGLASRLGFVGLSIAWLYTGLRAYLAIRAGDTATHRAWMIRNFALTFAAVMLRLYVPGAIASGIAFETAYPVIAWLCWVPNLLAAQWILSREGQLA